MNKLRNKTFFLLLSILTIFLFTILFIYNFASYKKEYENIKNQLIKTEATHNNFFPKKNNQFSEKRPMFIDSTVYVVTFDSNLSIQEVINYSDNGLDDEYIKTLATNYIKKYKTNSLLLKNIYFNKYSYSYRNNNLIIVDNSEITNRLINTLFLSLILFVILEIIIILVVIKITKWLVKPVEEDVLKQKQFIYDASHELKTPLAVIIASAETLEKNIKDNKWLNIIETEANRMNRLIVNLLELAKSQNNNKEEYSVNDLSKIILKATLPFESLIFEKGLKLNLEIEDNINLACNPDKIKELVGILVDNAIKHSLEKAKITVLLKKDKLSNSIVLEVINRGDEIPKEEQNKIFERFYRVDKSRNRDSNRYGLGLAIAKNIATNHNANISVSCENGYTTFKVHFKQT